MPQNSLQVLTWYCRCCCWTDWENTLEHNEEWKELLQQEFGTCRGRDLLVFCFVLLFVFSIWSTVVVGSNQWYKHLSLYLKSNGPTTTGFQTFACPMLRSRNSAKNELLLMRELREGILSHGRCCLLWLRYDGWVNRLSHNCVAVTVESR